MNAAFPLIRQALPTLAVTGVHVVALAVLLAAVHRTQAEPQPLPVMRAVMIAPEPPKPLPMVAPAVKPTPRLVTQQISRPQPKPTPMPLLKNAPPSPTAISAPPTMPPAPPEPAKAAPQPAPQPAPLTQPRSEASGLNNPQPPYPSVSRKLGEEGTVMLDVHVLANGMVDDVKIKRSSGFDRLDQSARDTVKKWRFIPAKQGETALAVWYAMPVEFSLNKP